MARATVGALLAGTLSVVFVLSFVGLIFAGPLSADFPRAIGFVLFGATVMALVAAVAMPWRGTVIQPQDAPGVLLGIAAASVAAGWVGGPDGLFATVVVMVSTATLLTGIVLLVAGWLRLGHMARYIPYPVICGFLAASGLRLLLAAVEMATGLPAAAASVPELLRPEVALLWVPPVLCGCALVGLTQWARSGLALPGGLMVIAAGFYVALAVAGRDMEWAGQAGLLLRVGPDTDLLASLGPWVLAEADWWVIAGQAPALLAVAGLAVLSVTIYGPALEVSVQTRINNGRELRGVGLANLAGAFGGTMPGFHYYGVTILAWRLGVRGVWVCLGVAACSAAVLGFGGGLLGLLPVGLFASIVTFVGLDLMRRWLWGVRHQMPPWEFAITAAITAAAVLIGLMEAIALGLLAAVVLFVVAYGGLDVVRLRTTAAHLRSRVERSVIAEGHLARDGQRAAVLQLEGFLFFGTAMRLRDEVLARLEARAPALEFVVLDVRRVSGLDASAAQALVAVRQACAEAGATLLICGQRPSVADALRRAGLDTDGTCRFGTCDAALRFVEDAILTRAQDVQTAEAPFLDALCRAHPDFRPADWFQRRDIPRGAALFDEGAPADCMALIETGILRAEQRRPDGLPLTVGTLLPGAVVGEIGLYAGVTRTARVVAETDVTVLVMTAEALRRLEASAPKVSASMHRLAASHLARRLMLTSKLMRDADL